MNKNEQIVEVESFSTLGVRYEVDLTKGTCTCPAFMNAPAFPCKHLRSFEGLFQQVPEPDPHEALSAFIKSIRLRRTEDAVLWLLYLWRIPQYRGRAQRRVLIAAAEDNLSAGVIERVNDWYNSLERTRPESAVGEVLRICGTRNWWAQLEGRRYIYAWQAVEADAVALKDIPEESLLHKAASCFRGQDLLGALAAFSALHAKRKVVPQRIAGLLNEIALQGGSRQAQKLASLYAANLRTQGGDANLSGQAFYAAITGDFGDQAVPEVGSEDVRRLIVEASRKLAQHPQIPAWALDGVHTGRFRDGRFAGTTRMMAACCRAYEHFGRLWVEDPWPTSLRSGR